MSDDKPDFEVTSIDHLTARDEAWSAMENLTHIAHPQISGDAVKVERYLSLLEKVANDAFNSLAQDRYYSPGVNKAWSLLGKLLQKLSSDDEPFKRRE